MYAAMHTGGVGGLDRSRPGGGTGVNGAKTAVFGVHIGGQPWGGGATGGTGWFSALRSTTAGGAAGTGPVATGLPAQVAAQLMRQEGRASHATVLATAAFAVPLIVQRTQLGAAEKVLPYYQRMVVTPDAQLVTLVSAS